MSAPQTPGSDPMKRADCNTAMFQSSTIGVPTRRSSKLKFEVTADVYSKW